MKNLVAACLATFVFGLFAAASVQAQCTLGTRFPNGTAAFKSDLNANLGDYGTLFENAGVACCAERVQSLLYQKVSDQIAHNGFQNRWLGGGDIYLITAAALQLGAQGLLTPDLDAKIHQAIGSYNFFKSCNPPSDTCMDDYSVAAAGFAWAALYEAQNGRPYSSLAGTALSHFHSSFSQTESVCLHSIAQSCTTCLQISNPTDLQTQIAAGTLEVLTYNHGFANPNYGLGLLTSLSAASEALSNLPGTTYAYSASALEPAIAQGLFREAQHNANPATSVCSNSWAANCYSWATCGLQSCGDSTADGPYTPDMYPVKPFLSGKLAIGGGLPLVLTTGSVQFDNFCANKFATGNGFFQDGRLAVYRDLAWSWPYLHNQPGLSGANAIASPAAPLQHVDVPAGNQSLGNTTTFSGWAIASDAAIASLSFTLDGHSYTGLQNFTYGVPRQDVCDAYSIAECGGCPVGWSGSFNPTGITNGSHTLVATAKDADGQTSTFSRTFIVNVTAPPTGCPHSECTVGAAMPASCSPCATTICATDSVCCNESWDGICVGKAASPFYCNFRCPS